MALETQKAEVVETKPAPEPEPSKVEEEKKVEVDEEKKEDEPVISQTASFKEESNVVANLIDPEKKALDELKELIVAALANNEFARPPPPPPVKEDEKKEDEKKEEEKKEDEKKEEEKKEEEKKEEEKKKEGEKEEEKKEEGEKEEGEKEEEKKEEEKKEEGKKEEEKKEEAVVEKSEEPKATPAKEEKPSSETSPAEEKKAKEEEKGTSEVAAPEEEEKNAVVVAVEESIVQVPGSGGGGGGGGSGSEEEKKCDEQANPAAGPAEEIFIWGVPLVGGGEKSDTLLLKFLRARDFKVKDALTMIKNSVIWRKEFGIDALLDEDLGLPELEKVVFMHGNDKDGHPVCYNVYGEFQEKDLYQKAFGDDEKRKNFLRWRVRVLEKGIREKLDFSPEGVCTMVQVTDLKNSPGPGKTELRHATNQALHLLQDNYPEFAAKQIFINVPWWYLAFNRMIAPFFTQRSKSKFVFAGPSKSAETLFKYIAPEQVPVQYGGLSMDTDNTEFSTSDAVTEVSIKPTSKHTVEIPVTQGTVLVWELRVLRWDVSYGAEFVSDMEGAYTVIVQKTRKFVSTDEAVARNSFKIGEPGKVVLTVDNTTHKKKKLLYRYKIKSSTD